MNEKKITLNGNTYRFNHMPAADGAKFGIAAVKQVVEPLEMMFSGKIAEFLEETDDLGVGVLGEITSVFMQILPTLDEERIPELMEEVLRKCVTCDAGPLSDDMNFETWFEKNRGDYYAAAIWAAWESSRPFLEDAIPALAQLMEAGMPSISTSPQANSTDGSSLESPPGRPPSAGTRN